MRPRRTMACDAGRFFVREVRSRGGPLLSFCLASLVVLVLLRNACRPRVTKSVVASIFGAGLRPRRTRDSSCVAVLQVSPPGVSLSLATPLRCDVGTNPRARDQRGLLRLQFKEYGKGREFEVAVPGAGSGAVLVEDTNYGPSTLALSPYLLLADGGHTVAVYGAPSATRVFKNGRRWLGPFTRTWAERLRKK